MKLSIVVPVYNVERYLAKCLLSLFDQDIDAADYEIVVVDDSSTDGSRAVADGFAEMHRNIRIVDQMPNAGLGEARNHGIDEATGKYIMFVDSDDFIAPHSLGAAVRTMEAERLDMLAFGYEGVDGQGRQIAWGPGAVRISDPRTLSGGEYILRNQFVVMIPTYMFRRAFLDENNLRMLPGRRHEDEEFLPRALCLCRRIRYYPHTIYYYLCRQGSIMTSRDRRNITDLIECIGSLDRFLRGGAVQDKRVVARIRYLMSVQLYRAMRESLRIEGITPREVREMMRRQGLLPLANPRGHLNRFLINHSLPAFVFYNTRIRKRK